MGWCPSAGGARPDLLPPSLPPLWPPSMTEQSKEWNSPSIPLPGPPNLAPHLFPTFSHVAAGLRSVPH